MDEIIPWSYWVEMIRPDYFNNKRGRKPIGIEIVRTEVIYHKAVLERIEYVATTYGCPECKDSLEPQFIKDEGMAPLVPVMMV